MQKRASGKFKGHRECLNVECGSSDALALYEQPDGTTNGYCWSCETFFPNLSEEEGANNKMIRQEDLSSFESVDDINGYQTRALDRRGISALTAKRFGVKVGINPSSGEVDSHYYPYYKDGIPVAYKKRALPKSFVTVGDFKDTELFGQHLCGNGGKLLIIVEGEVDTMSAYEMFRLKGKNYRVVGLPTGANTKAIRNNLEWIEKFETVVLALDQDDKGRQATHQIADIIANGKVRLARFSEKDPNDMLQQGKADEFLNAVFNAEEFRPDGIVSIDDIFEEAVKPVEWGKPWPWPALTNLTFGRRRKELYGLGGGTGTGKTEVFKEVIDHIIETEEVPVGVFFLEEEPAMTAKILAGKSRNKTFHIPDSGWEQDELTSALTDLRGKVFLYNHFGNKDYDALKAKIRYMVVSLGIRDVFLDHLTALVADEPDENKALGRIMSDMAALTQELDFTLYYISHLTTPQNGPSHEEGGRVTSSQFRGSRSIAFWSNFLFGLERNQQAEGSDERHTVTFRVLKDRYTGRSTGEKFKMTYNHETGRLVEKEHVDEETEF